MRELLYNSNDINDLRFYRFMLFIATLGCLLDAIFFNISRPGHYVVFSMRLAMGGIALFILGASFWVPFIKRYIYNFTHLVGILYTANLLALAYYDLFGQGNVVNITMVIMGISILHRRVVSIGIYLAGFLLVLGILLYLVPSSHLNKAFIFAMMTVTSLIVILLNYQRIYAANQLKQSSEFLRTLFNSATDAVVIATNKGIILDSNEVAIKMYEFAKKEDLIGKHIDDLVKKNFTVEEQSELLREINSKGIWRREQLCVTQTGKEFWGDTAISNIRIEKVKYLFVRILDISKRKQIEEDLIVARDEAEAAGRAKADFLATMSHEIRTPMNAVIGMTGLLMETPLNEEQTEFVETIRNSGENLLTIINDILDYSKIESGRFDLEIHPFALSQVVEDVLDLLSQKAGEKGIELIYYIHAEVPEVIMTDSTRLRQVLVNLVNNAVKFTEKGEVYVVVKQLSNNEGRLNLQFEIHDTGIGIAQDKIGQLFESFTQADTSTTRKYGGTGLGLAISKRLVQYMGGNIWAESTLGKGSTFYFTIATSKGILPKKEEKPVYETSFKGKTALIVDDNATNLRILDLQLGRWGFHNLKASHPQEALDLLEKGTIPDIAIIDFQMPDMNGLDLTAKIRETYGKEQLPIIILTSMGNPPMDKDAALYNAYLNKPVKQSHLYNSINKSLYGKVFEKRPYPLPEIGGNNVGAQKTGNSSIKILLAEDNDINQKVAIAMFNRLGYQADVAANGLEVLHAFQRQQYDIVFMDVQMPEMDGIVATEKLRATMPNPHSPIIVAMTANAMEEDRQRCLSAGMDDYIAKPVKLEIIKASIEKWFPASKDA
ncbi:MAG: response regulator [Chitinophagales bacterium]|nr:response regulator [Chitinophagales bacterium]